MEGLPLAGNAPKLKPRKEEDGRMLKVPLLIFGSTLSRYFIQIWLGLWYKKYSYLYPDSKASMYRWLLRYK